MEKYTAARISRRGDAPVRWLPTLLFVSIVYLRMLSFLCYLCHRVLELSISSATGC